MKKMLYILPVVMLMIGCSQTFERRNPSMSESLVAKDNIIDVERESAKNSETKLEEVAVLAAGTQHSLSKEPEPSRAVEVAKDLNQRVMSLSGSPTVDELNRVYKLVDDLTSQMQLERERGLSELAKRDRQITSLQQETKLILAKKDTRINELITVSEKNASALDAANVQLSQMNKFFGLGAVFYGLKKFLMSAVWIIGGFALVFTVLRVFSYHPMVGAVFSIFEVIASFVINTVKGLVPGSIKFASLAPVSVVNQYKRLSEKIVDVFETLRDRDEAVLKQGGQPKQYTLLQVLSMFSESFGDDDKKLVKEIKSRLGW